MKSISSVLVFLVLVGLPLSVGCDREETSSTALAFVEPAPADLATPSGDQFADPVRIKAGDEFVSVESPGYACPTMADVDGDGKDDLVIGQFSNGNMQFCKNVSTADAEPQFASPTWLKTNGERAIVPGVW